MGIATLRLARIISGRSQQYPSINWRTIMKQYDHATIRCACGMEFTAKTFIEAQRQWEEHTCSPIFMRRTDAVIKYIGASVVHPTLGRFSLN
jgi:hypothetical protein